MKTWIAGARLITATLGIGALGALATAQPGGGPPPVNVVVNAAKMQRVEGLREVTGELRANKRSMIASEASGIVVELLTREGDAVAMGDALAHLNDERAQLRKRSADADVEADKALVAEREADLAKADRDLARLEALQQRSSASENEVEDARTAKLRAEARLQQARSELIASEADAALAQDELDDMIIRAPYAGSIASRQTEVGQWVREGEAVVELVALDRLEAWLDMPERYAGRFTTSGMLVNIRVNAFNELIEGRLLQVLPVLDPLSRIFTVRVEIDNANARFKPGMSVIGLAPTGEDVDVLTVHKDAILRDNAGAYLFYDAGSVAMAARVNELFPIGDRMAIKSAALQPGTMVVVEGNERLFPGAPLITSVREDASLARPQASGSRPGATSGEGN
jgi:RND family efflux transporter MFP subunit